MTWFDVIKIKEVGKIEGEGDLKIDLLILWVEKKCPNQKE